MYAGLIDRNGREITGKRGYHRVYLGEVHWVISPADSGEINFMFINITEIRFPHACGEDWGYVFPVVYKEAYGEDIAMTLFSAGVYVPAGLAPEFRRGAFKIDATTA